MELTKSIQVGPYTIKTRGLRLKCFKHKGLSCVRCNLQGKFFQIDFNGSNPHFNLYGIRDYQPILMTRDHIIPLSKGGPNTLDNLQTMCVRCNGKKADKIDV